MLKKSLVWTLSPDEINGFCQICEDISVDDEKDLVRLW